MMTLPMSEKPAAPPKLSGVILDRLLAMIESGEIPPGGQLPSERELMRRFEVGRPAVREALQTLANMGLAQIRHGGRARLLAIEPRHILDQIDRAVRHLLMAGPENRRHLSEARLLFETGMVRLAAAKAGPDDIAALEQALEKQSQACGDIAAFIACDIAFHTEIARVSRNPVFSAVSEALLQWLFGSTPRLLRVPGTEALTLAEHGEILRAITAHDPDAAAFALRMHLTRTHPLYNHAPA
jgi:GntR family transcriptional regulator, sialic acid-inducible nan operon repressor